MGTIAGALNAIMGTIAGTVRVSSGPEASYVMSQVGNNPFRSLGGVDGVVASIDYMA